MTKREVIHPWERDVALWRLLFVTKSEPKAKVPLRYRFTDDGALVRKRTSQDDAEAGQITEHWLRKSVATWESLTGAQWMNLPLDVRMVHPKRDVFEREQRRVTADLRAADVQTIARGEARGSAEGVKQDLPAILRRMARQERHEKDLFDLVNALGNVSAMSLRDENLADWVWSGSPSWPVAQGQAYSDPDGAVTVTLDADGSDRFWQLQAHLGDDPLFPALARWKEAMAADLHARRVLLETVARRIAQPSSLGGLGLPVRLDLDQAVQEGPAVGKAYVVALYLQVLARAGGLASPPLSRADFNDSHSGYPGYSLLGTAPALFARDARERERAKRFFVRAQEEWAALPEAMTAAQTCPTAEAATKAAQGECRRILALDPFPVGILCAGCPQ